MAAAIPEEDEEELQYEDAFTIYGHPNVKDVLTSFDALAAIKLPHYRTALKLRVIQRRMQLHRVDVVDMIQILEQVVGEEEDGCLMEPEMETPITDICLMAEKCPDSTNISCTDLILTWVLQLYDADYAGTVTVRQFITALITLAAGRLTEKLKFLCKVHCDVGGTISRRSFTELLTNMLMIPCVVFEDETYGHAHFIETAVLEAFHTPMGELRESVTAEEFLGWCSTSPSVLSWLFALHRLHCSEYSVQLTPCSICSNAPYLGFRYVSLHRPGLAICQACFWTGRTSPASPPGCDFREFGALSQHQNVCSVAAETSSDTNTILQNALTALDDRYPMLLAYAKRLNPQSANHFVKVDLPKTADDGSEALAGECEDRGVQLQREFTRLLNIHQSQLSQGGERLAEWRARDELSAELASWMSKRNDLYVRVEGLFQEAGVPVPTLIRHRPASPPPTSQMEATTTIDKSAESLVLGKLNILVSSYMLERSLNTIKNESPVKPSPRSDSIQTPPPLKVPISGAGAAAAAARSTPSPVPPARSPAVVIQPTAEKDALKIFDDTVNDIMRQEDLYDTPPPSVDLVLPSGGGRTDPPTITSPNGEEEITRTVSPMPPARSLKTPKSGPDTDSRADTEPLSGELWESEGEWETEEEITAASTPPESLELGVPVPPPRTLLSPMQNASRRATSLKTKDKTSDPRMEELRKVTRASSSVHTKTKPACLPALRNAETTPNVASGSATLQRNLSPQLYEGDSDNSSSSDSSSSSSISSEDEPRRKVFSRSRSARFQRARVAAPNRNAASFRGKKSRSNAPPPPPSEPLEFFNKFADLS